MSLRLRFHGELNDFLPLDRRSVVFTHELTRRTSIKDLIESLGVPHAEVGGVWLNDQPVDFSCIVQPDDRIEVFPAHELPQSPRFVVDANLGQLARYLRLLGFDTLYRNDFTDREIARLARDEQRFVLTRDRGLLQHKVIARGRFVRAVKPREQVREVLARLDLYSGLKPFSRCLRCNGELQAVEKDTVQQQLEPETRKYYRRFWRCPACSQIYWEGSHFRRLQQLCEYFAEPGTGV